MPFMEPVDAELSNQQLTAMAVSGVASAVQPGRHAFGSRRLRYQVDQLAQQ